MQFDLKIFVVAVEKWGIANPFSWIALSLFPLLSARDFLLRMRIEKNLGFICVSGIQDFRFDLRCERQAWSLVWIILRAIPSLFFFFFHICFKNRYGAQFILQLAFLWYKTKMSETGFLSWKSRGIFFAVCSYFLCSGGWGEVEWCNRFCGVKYLEIKIRSWKSPNHGLMIQKFKVCIRFRICVFLSFYTLSVWRSRI